MVPDPNISKKQHGELLVRLEALFHYRREHPLLDQGDVEALKLRFDNDWVKFVLAWAIREVPWIHAFYDGGFFEAKAIEISSGECQHIPKLSRWRMSPQEVEKWDMVKVRDLAKALERATACPDVKSYKAAVAVAKKLTGLGMYGATHVVRTAYLMRDIEHPCREFVIMSNNTGATKEKYAFFIDRGIVDGPNLNLFIERNMPHEHPINVGELAYLLCEGDKDE